MIGRKKEETEEEPEEEGDIPVRREGPTRPDEMEKGELMALFRDLLGRHGPTERQALIRLAAEELGYQRLRDGVAHSLDSALVTAVRRGVLANDKGVMRVFLTNLPEEEGQFQFLKTQLLAAVSENGRVWMTRNEAVRAFARWFGFRRTGRVIEETAQKLIKRLLRAKKLEADGEMIRRV